MIGIVSVKLGKLKNNGKSNDKFSGVDHYLVYEAPCSIPSNFDAKNTYGYGSVEKVLCCNGNREYIATLFGLERDVEE